MKLLVHAACFTLISCSAGKIPLQDTCSMKQVSGGYNRTGDSTFTLEAKQLGRTYLDFRIDSCYRISSNEIGLKGYISFADIIAGNERKMPGVDIIQVTPVNRQALKHFRYSGKTDPGGKFDIKVNAKQRDIILLLDKQNFSYTSVSLSF